MVAAEQDLLRALGFGVRPDLPFAFLLNYLRALAAPAALASTGAFGRVSLVLVFPVRARRAIPNFGIV